VTDAQKCIYARRTGQDLSMKKRKSRGDISKEALERTKQKKAGLEIS